MKNKLTLTGANVLLFAFIIVFLAYQFIASFFLGEVSGSSMYAFLIINELLIASSVIIYCIVKKINIRETFRIRKLEPVPAIIIVLLAVPLYLAALMLNVILIYGLQFIAEPLKQNLPVPGTPLGLVVGILIIAVMPGICEELMYRGFLLTAYERRGSYRAVVFVAILFGLFHFDITNLAGPVFLGLVFGYYVVRTGSIFAGMLAHFLNNLIAVMIQYLWTDPYSSDSLLLTWQDVQSVIALGIPALVVAAALLYLFRYVTEGKTEMIRPISRPGQDVKAILSHWPVAAMLAIYVVLTVMSLFVMMTIKS